MKDIKIPIPNTKNEQIPIPILPLSSHFTPYGPSTNTVRKNTGTYLIYPC